MLGFEAVIEQRIEEAARRGEFDDLPGAGRPLELDEDRLVPEDLRVAYHILKNAGFVPPEIQAINEIAALERLIHTQEAGEQRNLARLRLHLLAMQMGETRTGNLQMQAGYYDRVVASLSRP